MERIENLEINSGKILKKFTVTLNRSSNESVRPTTTINLGEFSNKNIILIYGVEYSHSKSSQSWNGAGYAIGDVIKVGQSSTPAWTFAWGRVDVRYTCTAEHKGTSIKLTSTNTFNTGGDYGTVYATVCVLS